MKCVILDIISKSSCTMTSMRQFKNRYELKVNICNYINQDLDCILLEDGIEIEFIKQKTPESIIQEQTNEELPIKKKESPDD